jgi:hypothetical protein
VRELQKHVETVGKEMEKAIEKHCGPDPATTTRAGRASRSATRSGKAPTSSPRTTTPTRTWKEWVLEFCKYIEALKKQPDAAQKTAKIKDEGLRIPGSGTGIYYVYTASEASALLEQCESLVPLIQATL